MARLTDQILDIMSYASNLQKQYTDNKVTQEVEKYDAELSKTRDDLKALIDALDALDFKEDGEIDAKIITAKVAENEASVKVNKDEIDEVKTKINKIQETIDNAGVASSEDIAQIKEDLDTIKVNIDSIEDRIKNNEDKIAELVLDVEKIKAGLANNTKTNNDKEDLIGF